jgi:hypothetical protein
MSEQEVRTEEEEELALEAREAQELPVGGEEEELPELSVAEIEGLLIETDTWDKLLSGRISIKQAEKTFTSLWKQTSAHLGGRRSRGARRRSKRKKKKRGRVRGRILLKRRRSLRRSPERRRSPRGARRADQGHLLERV